MKNNYVLLAEILKLKRVAMGYSKRNLASEVGISHTELTRIENGSRENYNVVTLINLCNVLKIHFVRLLKISGYLPCKKGEFPSDVLEFVKTLDNELGINDEEEFEVVAVLRSFYNMNK